MDDRRAGELLCPKSAGWTRAGGFAGFDCRALWQAAACKRKYDEWGGSLRGHAEDLAQLSKELGLSVSVCGAQTVTWARSAYINKSLRARKPPLGSPLHQGVWGGSLHGMTDGSTTHLTPKNPVGLVPSPRFPT
jgi:hypothetical protein